MSQSCKNICSTKISSLNNNKQTSNRLSKLINNENQNDHTTDSNIKIKEAHVFIRDTSKIHSDQIGKFPYVNRSGNQYVIVVCVTDPSFIFATAFKNKT